MEEIIAVVLGLSEGSLTTIILAFIGLLGTAATVGYKYQSNKTAPPDNNKVLFDQVNDFIEQQKQDRDELRKELKEVKDELEIVRQENRKLREENEVLRGELIEVRRAAKMVAQAKLEQDEQHGL